MIKVLTLLLSMVSSLALADSSFVAPSAVGQAAAGQIPGTTTNDNASAGNVGEYISSTVLVGSAVVLATSAPGNVTTVSLTAGDWECSGNVAFTPNGATLQTQIAGWISSTSAAVPTAPNNGSEALFSLSLGAGAVTVLPVGSIRFSLAGTTTIYLTGFSTFTVSSNSVYGHIHCRRMR